MMLPLQDILNKYSIHPKGIIHVGAHWAQEHDEFVKCGIEEFVYIEPCREAYKIICDKYGRGIAPDAVVDAHFRKTGFIVNNHPDRKIRVYNFACGHRKGEMPMYVSHQNQGQSNSLLEPCLHKQQHPEIIFDDAEVVKVVPLDEIIYGDKRYDMLYMDVQGYEGEVLKGATETLKQIDIIYTEVNRGQTYSGNMEIDEMDSFLLNYGFQRAETHWPSPNWTWGDAVYIKHG
jgi:FkbM family methyltransferase